ncbi:porin [Stratiformator vulcanicus]|uniref:Porin P n=1 Tax=Stratiformator vulcanicus TaxID=2527980 RepID=A0A517R4B7_9PLAN|nr:porin [Stratiformator vulcanicus]QDT38732.1 Porin P precursor [Stratiformator vulcanicus]
MGGDTNEFWSAYGQVAWLLTGEVRPYQRAAGVFGAVVPRQSFRWGRGLGAWELAGRLSWIDLDDDPVTGNRLTDTTVGLNWYLNQHTKFQFNWIHALLDGTAVPSSNADIFALRAQVDFKTGGARVLFRSKNPGRGSVRPVISISPVEQYRVETPMRPGRYPVL